MSAIPSAFDQRFQQRPPEPVSNYYSPRISGFRNPMLIRSDFVYLVASNAIAVLSDELEIITIYDIPAMISEITRTAVTPLYVHAYRTQGGIKVLYEHETTYIEVTCNALDCSAQTITNPFFTNEVVASNIVYRYRCDREYSIHYIPRDKEFNIVYFDGQYKLNSVRPDNSLNAIASLAGFDSDGRIYMVRELSETDTLSGKILEPVYYTLKCNNGITFEGPYPVQDPVQRMFVMLSDAERPRLVLDGTLLDLYAPAYVMYVPRPLR